MRSRLLVMPRIRRVLDTRYPSGYPWSFWISGPAEQIQAPVSSKVRTRWACGLTGFFGTRPKVTWIPGIMVFSAATERGNSGKLLWNRSPFHSKWGTFVSPMLLRLLILWVNLPRQPRVLLVNINDSTIFNVLLVASTLDFVNFRHTFFTCFVIPQLAFQLKRRTIHPVHWPHHWVLSLSTSIAGFDISRSRLRVCLRGRSFLVQLLHIGWCKRVHSIL